MSSIIPDHVPQLRRDDVLALLSKHGVHLQATKVAVLSVRGYYANQFGEPGENDRGVYDDAGFLVTARGTFLAANFNVDPSPEHQEGVATIIPGVYPYRQGIHNLSKSADRQYPAFRPATPGERIPCTRDGQPGTSFAVAANIHRGEITSTSSLACQTVPRPQWLPFQHLGYLEMDREGVDVFQYCLIENQEVLALGR